MSARNTIHLPARAFSAIVVREISILRVSVVGLFDQRVHSVRCANVSLHGPLININMDIEFNTATLYEDIPLVFSCIERPTNISPSYSCFVLHLR